eukprot:m.5463 g.5463  ORF g.5463 m.5463 type:complete len:146 (-) comp3312_c0_seq2:1575-2012(-)
MSDVIQPNMRDTFVAQETITKLQEKAEVVPFLGKTGSGKSSTITTSLGGFITENNIGEMEVHAHCEVPKTSDHLWKSTTFHPEVYDVNDDKNGVITMVDFAGICDRDEEIHTVWFTLHHDRMQVFQEPNFLFGVFLLPFSRRSWI